MTKIYCVEGKQNSGKTTLIWAVYQCLAELFKGENPHMFQLGVGQGWIFETMPLVFHKDGGLRDFQAVFIVNGIKIGIISAGDYEDVVISRINDHIKEYGVDILLCARRDLKLPSLKVLVGKTSIAQQCTIAKLFASNKNVPAKDVVDNIIEPIVNNVDYSIKETDCSICCKKIEKIFNEVSRRGKLVRNKSIKLKNV